MKKKMLYRARSNFFLYMVLCIGILFGEEETPWIENLYKKDCFHNNLEGVRIESYFESENEQVGERGPEFESENEQVSERGPEAEEQGLEKYFNPERLKEYHIKVGDKFLITVYGEADSRRIVSVDQSGAISYLIVNAMPVKGQSIEKFRHILQEKLSVYYRDPVLVITPIFFSGDYYTIMGEVQAPGAKPFVGNPTVTTALTKAAGFNTRTFRQQTIDQMDLDHSFLSRKGEYVPIDFTRLVEHGDMSQDIPLLPGDYIYIAPFFLSRVFVIGEVRRSNSVAFVDSLSLTEALSETGGLTQFASSRVAVIRGSLCCPVRYLVDVNRIIKGCACDFQLEPGDIVYVPSMQYTTFKEITKAGIASFVSIAASIAGANTFVSVHPHAAITGVITPVPIINSTLGSSFFSLPGAAAAGVAAP